ncbi:MAG: hypothetical protein IID37_10885, partial [Planctomycetes bacterium]|nr:hypothetical protein [Planctomycetota bacterium]
PGAVDSDGFLNRQLTTDSEAESPAGPTSPLLARRRREQAVERLEQGFQQVVGMVDAIRAHLDTQEGRTREIADSLGRLAETMVRMPETAAATSDSLAAIADQIQAANDRSDRWEDTLGRLPELADAQRETLENLSRQMSGSREHEERLAGTMDGFRRAVESLDSSSSASAEMLKGLRIEATARDVQLGELVRDQARRLTLLFASTLVLAAIGVGIGIVALLR